MGGTGGGMTEPGPTVKMDRHRTTERKTKLRSEVLPSDVRKVIVGEDEQSEWSSNVDQEDPEIPASDEDWIKSSDAPLTLSPGEKTKTCTDCGKTFGFRGDLRRHLRVHTGEKPFSCSVCSSSFNRRDTLLKHKRSHTGEKPFVCSLCTKRFSDKGSMKKHLRTHGGTNPFICSVCSTSFNRRQTLVEHMRVHSGEKRYSCSVCQQRFTWRSQFQRHRCGGGRRPRLLHSADTSTSDP